MMSISSFHIPATLSQHPFLSCPPSCLVTMRSTAMALVWCFPAQVLVGPTLLLLKAAGHGCLGTCCGGMCPQRASCPVTVSSYLCNPEQILSAQLQSTSAGPGSASHSHQPSPSPPWQLEREQGARSSPVCCENVLFEQFVRLFS